MQINVSGVSFELTEAIVNHVKERITQALSTAEKRIELVTVHLADINGSRGGVDKRCRIVATVRGLEPLVVSDLDRDLYVAIDSAAGRLKDVVWRQLKRRRTLGREFANRAFRRALV